MSGIGNLNSLENYFIAIPDFTDLKLEADKGKNTIEIKISKISETKKENYEDIQIIDIVQNISFSKFILLN